MKRDDLIFDIIEKEPVALHRAFEWPPEGWRCSAGTPRQGKADQTVFAVHNR